MGYFLHLRLDEPEKYSNRGGVKGTDIGITICIRCCRGSKNNDKLNYVALKFCHGQEEKN